MESGWYIWNLKNRLAIVLLLCLLSACSGIDSKKDISLPIVADTTANALLVCRKGNGFFSTFFRQYASQEQLFSHIGILAFEKDTLYVYHSEASELTGIGKVKREPIGSFLQGIQTYAFYTFHYPDSVKTGILKAVKTYYRQGVPFDINFDSDNDQALYCTELIAAAVNKAIDSTIIQPSLFLGDKHLYSIDDICSKTQVKIKKINK